ncbi:uncharacterized protein LOC131152190 [Malania oleifera]|uniref:uncharacterized protein LOC131152190 n=1 Tax=Malania oleifera TaxID=397392 RepID=UPI0025ADFCCD|nr:uncharacterized protein LOC131152190 [Malania oleifera]
MSHHPRRVFTPGASRKRKETDAFHPAQPPMPLSPAARPPGSTAAAATTTSSARAAEAISSNRLVAGYMAYEFLTKGTLFGQKWDPARAEAVPLAAPSAESKRARPSQIQSQGPSHSQSQSQGQIVEALASPRGAAGTAKRHQSYAEVANLLKADGAHIPGIVNPTQLARWIQM